MGLNLNYKEGQTPIDEEEKDGLKIKAITTQGELNEFEQLNIENAIQWLLSTNLKPEIVLTEPFIKKVHQKMFGEVWKWAGTYRKTNKNIGVKWSQIGLQLKQLLGDTQYWISNNTYHPDEIAIRFKHRLVAIHCFPNGNGRHARVMADIIIETIFKKEIFTWHQSNLIKANAIRKEYIFALKQADNGNIKPLIEFAKK